MNFGLRAGQLMAERSDVRRMNIRDRTALWYRLERIGAATETPKEEVIVKHIYQHYHSNISRKQWDTFEQTIRKVDYLERKLKEPSDKKKKEEYSISGEG